MEAHAGTITIRTGRSVEPRSRLTLLREVIRRRRLKRADRAYNMRMNRASISSVPGSEHALLMRRPRGF